MVLLPLSVVRATPNQQTLKKLFLLVSAYKLQLCDRYGLKPKAELSGNLLTSLLEIIPYLNTYSGCRSITVLFFDSVLSDNKSFISFADLPHKSILHAHREKDGEGFSPCSPGISPANWCNMTDMQCM